MNRIIESQNEKKMVDLLKLQKYTYGRVSFLSTLCFITCVILPLALTIINQLVIATTWQAFFNLLIGTLAISILFFNDGIKNVKEYAAKVQAMFENTVFGFKVENISPTLNEMLVKSKNKKVQKQKGLEDWYPQKYADLEKNKAIFYCQLSNVKWDKALRSYYKCFILIATIVSVLVVLIIAIFFYITVLEFISHAAVVMPIIVYVAQFYVAYTGSSKEQKELLSFCREIEKRGKFAAGELQSIQNKLFQFRRNTVKIPNWFFYIFRSKQQAEADEFANLIK